MQRDHQCLVQVTYPETSKGGLESSYNRAFSLDIFNGEGLGKIPLVKFLGNRFHSENTAIFNGPDVRIK